MSIIDQLRANLVDPDRHGPILEALVRTLEEEGERGVKDQIRSWVEEIEGEEPPMTESEE